MRFKKEDIGLYMASSLAGGGLGLLVGAFIASRLEEPIYIPEEDWREEAHVRLSYKNAEDFKARLEKAEKIAGGEKSRKTRIKLKAEDDPDLAKFIAEWEPSTIQIEMLRNDQTTMEEVQKIILDERAREEIEPYNYSAPYYDKPELSELVTLPEDEEIIDDRYQILQTAPTGKSSKSIQVLKYDPDDGGLFKMARNGKPVPTNLRKDMENTWEIVEMYLHKGYASIYVDDLETTRFWRFDIIPEDTEDSSDNGHDPNRG